MKDNLIYPLIVALFLTAVVVGWDMFKPPRDLYAQGMGPGPNVSRAVGALTCGTTSYDFGTVTSTATASYSMTCTAQTVLIYTGSFQIGGTNSAEFSYTHNLGTGVSVAKDTTFIVTMTFQPNATTGAKSGAYTMNYTW